MTPFDSCLAALKQPGPPETFFKAVDKALAEVVGQSSSRCSTWRPTESG
jgi:hypothetical protein